MSDTGGDNGGIGVPATEGDEGGHEGTLADHPLTAARLAKVEEIRQAGGDPYPVRFTPDAKTATIRQTYGDLGPGEATGTSVTVAGRLMGMRDIGKLVFGVLQDGTGRIQLFADRATLGDELAGFAALDIGDWIGVTGEVITTKRGELSVRVETFVLLAKSLRPMPEKWHGLQDVETRYRKRYLDLTVNEDARATLLARSEIVKALRDSFERRGFLEVETPMLQVRPGGALAKPFRTHHNALDIDMYLRIAPELYLKRLVVGGMERVFELNRNFRNEGVSPRHNPEFTMLEAYLAYADYHDVMDLLESVVAEVARAVVGTTELTYQGRPLDLTPPWKRVTVLGSIAEATGVTFSTDLAPEEAGRMAADLDVPVHPAWGTGKIIAEVFEAHAEAGMWQPTIVMDYPKEISPLARQHRLDPELTQRFELMVAGRELANAFSELNDPVEQRLRFEAQAAARAGGDEDAHPIDDDYVLALEYGLPPTGGLGLGVDRLVMLLTDQDTIREVILFPHMKPEA